MKICAALFIMLSANTLAQKANLVRTANTFLSSLPTDLRAKAQYELSDDERLNWHYIPKERNGVPLRELNTVQRNAALDLLRSSLSLQGFQKATAIMALENVLIEVENRGPNDTFRDPLNYYFTIFGNPSKDSPWGWRFEGHHIALNFSSSNNRIESSTPSFFGSNPGIVLQGKEKGKQVLKEETELGHKLVNALTAKQLETALISETPLPEIVSANSRKAMPLNPGGLSYAAMTDQQKDMLMKLLEVYVQNYELGFSHKLMEKIQKAGIEKLSFAWAGSLKAGEGHYYRIQGPMLLIELDNTQNNANHVHSVVRDLTNDFGEDILREHYEKEHTKK
ncbi:MAG: DUF3500 domain-containing protein [Cyclobacteriaceae bacterium]|nr:DUF3500 domain-containing protein [Cyclobacteriaceae bacterium]MDH4295911.1 DUF3500 domain-containing protein [Cyclobacteriaceae bacterium]MDH5247430.1 DUF3500 domain-containing protein [Cyclobacteriaceae bacterium]